MMLTHWRFLCLITCFFGLLACTKKKPTDTELADSPDKASQEKIVNLFTWPEYTSREVFDEFTKQTGIEVRESNYASNQELLAKLQAGATGFDVAIPSDYMVAVMTKLGLLQELDKSKLPNLQNLDPQVLAKPYDPENKVSVPYAWSMTGIAVNRKLYQDPVTGWSDLLTNHKVDGKVSLLDDSREVLAAALRMHGHSINSVDAQQLRQAQQTLQAAKRGVKAFNSSPIDQISSGEVWIAHMFSQEAMLASRRTQGAVEFIVPKEGATMSIDNMVILKSAQHKEAAHKLLDFLLDRKANTDFVARMLAGPVIQGIKKDLPVELQANSTLFPSAAVMNRLEMMQDLGENTRLYDRIWSELKIY